MVFHVSTFFLQLHPVVMIIQLGHTIHGGDSMKKKDDFEIRINPENRVCSKFNLQSLATFPVAAPGEMGMRVTDDCAEKHMM